MKKRISGLVLALAIMAFAPTAAAAAEVSMGSNVATAAGDCPVNSVNRGGAAALAALVAAAVAADVDAVILCNTEVLNNSLNNLLQNADIHALENILNNSPILNDLNISDITVNVLGGVTTISVLGAPILAFQ